MTGWHGSSRLPVVPCRAVPGGTRIRFCIASIGACGGSPPSLAHGCGSCLLGIRLPIDLGDSTDPGPPCTSPCLPYGTRNLSCNHTSTLSRVPSDLVGLDWTGFRVRIQSSPVQGLWDSWSASANPVLTIA